MDFLLARRGVAGNHPFLLVGDLEPRGLPNAPDDQVLPVLDPDRLTQEVLPAPD
jgi:hypothetical protein